MMQIYACEQLNQHSGSLVFLLGQLLSSIPFLFLISISSGLVFYFLIGLRDEFSLLMYFVLNFFMCLLVNEGLVLALVTIWQDVFWSILTLVCIHVSTWCTMQTFHVELIVELFFNYQTTSRLSLHSFVISPYSHEQTDLMYQNSVPFTYLDP